MELCKPLEADFLFEISAESIKYLKRCNLVKGQRQFQDLKRLLHMFFCKGIVNGKRIVFMNNNEKFI